MMNFKYISNIATNPKIPMEMGFNPYTITSMVFNKNRLFAFELDLTGLRIGDKVEELKLRLPIYSNVNNSFSFNLTAYPGDPLKGLNGQTSEVSNDDKIIDQVRVDLGFGILDYFELDITRLVQEKINEGKLSALVKIINNSDNDFILAFNEPILELDVGILIGKVYLQNNVIDKGKVIQYNIGSTCVKCHLPTFKTSIDLPGLTTKSSILPLSFYPSYVKKESLTNTIQETGLLGKGFNFLYQYKIKKLERSRNYGTGTTYSVTLSAYELEDYRGNKLIYTINEDDKYINDIDGSELRIFETEDSKYEFLIEFRDSKRIYFNPVNVIKNLLSKFNLTEAISIVYNIYADSSVGGK